MMLEALFAKQGQEQAFLALALCGWALGFLLHAGRWIRRRHRVLSMLWDVLTALAGLAMTLAVLLHLRTGLRGYGLLGLVTGLVLYLAGAFFVVEGLFRLMAWAAEKIRDSTRPKEGKAVPGANCSVQKREDASSGAARE